MPLEENNSNTAKRASLIQKQQFVPLKVSHFRQLWNGELREEGVDVIWDVTVHRWRDVNVIGDAVDGDVSVTGACSIKLYISVNYGFVVMAKFWP